MPKTSLAAVLGRLPSGLFILSVGDGRHETGMLCSWVMQAGFEPPMITAAVNRERFVIEWLTAGQPFVLSLLADKQKALVRHFGRGFEPGEPAFEGLDISRSSRGLPILTQAVGHLECQSTAHLDSGDHRIFLAEVSRGHLADDVGPMVHIRKNGLRY